MCIRIRFPKLAWLALASLFVVPVGLQAQVDMFTTAPQQVYSTNGILNLDLVVKNVPFTINGHFVPELRTYNGTFPGPTIRATPGDTLNIRYINRLPPADEWCGNGMVSTPNGVNLHTHGLNVSPDGYADNVFLDIEPGQYVPYQIPIPADHPCGNFWYHPHLHGNVNTDLASGLAGNLFISGGLGDLSQVPDIKNARTLEMIFNEIQLMPMDAGKTQFTVPAAPLDALSTNLVPDLYTIFTLNSLPVLEQESYLLYPPTNRFPTLPVINILPGEVQRWQFLNASVDKFVWLTITNSKSKAYLPMQLVAYDGITLHAPDTENGVFLSPANRVEFLVKGGAPGTNTFAAIPPPALSARSPEDRLFANIDVQLGYIPLATVICSGTETNMPLPTIIDPPVARLPNIATNEISGTRVITLNMSVPGYIRGGAPNGAGSTNGEPFSFTIGNQNFDPDRIDQTMVLNSAEEWSLKSTDTNLSGHPFHIHVNWFQVIAVDGVALPYPRWQDTVAVPKGQTVTIRHRFQNYAGKFVLHCHIVRHEDGGMMSALQIIDPGNFIYGGLDNDTLVDGYLNLYHYAFGFPTGYPYLIPAGYPQSSVVNVGGQNYLAESFNERTNPLEAALSYNVESSTDLFQWTPVSNLVGTPLDLSNGFQSVTVRDDEPIQTGTPARFLRMNLGRTEFNPLPIPAGFPD